jgi:hypothetical protein
LAAGVFLACAAERKARNELYRNHEDPAPLQGEAFCECAGKGEESTSGALFAFSFTVTHRHIVPREMKRG